MADHREDISPWAMRPIAIAAAVSAALVFATQSGDLLRPYLAVEPITKVPYLRSALTTIVDIVVFIGLVAMAAWRTPSAILGVAGLNAPILRPLLWGVVVFAPAGIYATLRTPLAPFDPGIWWTGIGGPFFEELGFRGLAVGALMRLAGWSLWPAALLPAAFFGAVHAWQGDDPASIAGIVAITGLGGVLFGWLFVRWNFNLWPPVIAHVGLNCLWTLFGLGETAVGGWLGNGIRLSVIALGVAMTFAMAPKR